MENVANIRVVGPFVAISDGAVLKDVTICEAPVDRCHQKDELEVACGGLALATRDSVPLLGA